MPPYAQRDAQTAKIFANMQQLGFTEEEITVYALGYLKAGQVYYFATANAETALHFQQDCLANQHYPTGIHTLTHYQKLYKDERRAILRQAKANAIKNLAAIYDGAFFAQLAQIVPPVSNVAYGYLHDWQRTLEGCYDYSQLTLCHAAIRCAYAWRILDDLSYSQFNRWFAYMYRQLEDEVVPTHLPAHVYAGFAYVEQNAALQYKSGSLKQILHQQESLEQLGLLISPIYVKTEYFSPESYLTTLAHKQAFIKELQEALSSDYMSRIQTLRAMIPPRYLKDLKISRQSCSFHHEKARQTFLLYSRRWNYQDSDIT